MKILIVVDMQNDFINGSLGTSEAVEIVDKVAAKIRNHWEKGGQVIFTRDTHGPDYLNTQEGRNLPVEHCVKGTQGWEISEILGADGAIIDKPGFGSFELVEYLKSFEISEIELVGLCTDICVISNAIILKAAFPEVPIKVDASCCAGVTPESHKNALEAMKMCQIIIENE